jgi:hypothetical protein
LDGSRRSSLRPPWCVPAERFVVSDLVFVVLTVALFAVVVLVVRGLERL